MWVEIVKVMGVTFLNPVQSSAPFLCFGAICSAKVKLISGKTTSLFLQTTVAELFTFLLSEKLSIKKYLIIYSRVKIMKLTERQRETGECEGEDLFEMDLHMHKMIINSRSKGQC